MLKTKTTCTVTYKYDEKGNLVEKTEVTTTEEYDSGILGIPTYPITNPSADTDWWRNPSVTYHNIATGNIDFNPCFDCDVGWGSVSTSGKGNDSCHNHPCERRDNVNREKRRGE